MSSNMDKIIDAMISAKYGPRPFDPSKDKPQDVGLGGLSTEYIAGAPDQNGNEFNYPQIWWVNGQPVLLPPDAAYDRALQYEQATGERFPRYVNPGASSFAAQNRSMMGGATNTKLAKRTTPYGNF